MSRRLYQALVLAAAALFAYLSLAVTVANSTASAAPSLALRFWPRHAVAEARTADALIVDNPRQDFARPAEYAEAALRRSPALPVAARVLGMRALVQGDQPRAERLFQYAERLSRRDIATQLWLLERRVQANDVAGALEHFRIVLRVSPGARDLLFPVLTSALAQPDLIGPITNRAFGEPWNDAFVRYAGSNAADPVVGARVVFLQARRGWVPPPDMIRGISGRLIERGRIDVAGRLYRLVDPSWNAADLNAQLDGGFSRTRDIPPFGWTLPDDFSWRGPPSGASTNNPALNVRAEGAASKAIASRLLQLRPGRYRLNGRFGLVEREGDWTLRAGLACVEAGTPEMSPSAALAGRGGAFQLSFVVLPGCRAPWMSLYLESAGEGRIEFWIDDLQLAAEGRAAS